MGIPQCRYLHLPRLSGWLPRQTRLSLTAVPISSKMHPWPHIFCEDHVLKAGFGLVITANTEIEPVLRMLEQIK